jgi:SpoVK/Ycf46/Vps4 family AAA+-type ATPase
MSEQPQDKAQKADRKPLEDVILNLCHERGADKSICPTDAAKAFAAARGEDDLAWRRWLSQVRAAAIGLARQGRLVIYRKGKPADPDDFRGVYRLGLPRSE